MSVTISMPEPYTDAERDEIIASEAAKGREVVSFGVDWGARSYVTRLNQKGYEDEIKRLTEENAKLKSALVWAENELCHATDDTGCCQPWCDSCKAIRDKAERERDEFQIALNSGLFEFKKRIMAERDAALARVAEMENKISPAR